LQSTTASLDHAKSGDAQARIDTEDFQSITAVAFRYLNR
jgi:hypothetical protein